jgi:hypothetical protein
MGSPFKHGQLSCSTTLESIASQAKCLAVSLNIKADRLVERYQLHYVYALSLRVQDTEVDKVKKNLFEKILSFFVILFFVRAFSALIKPFLPFDLPHVWRQVDTLGVSIRYWLRWTAESELHHPLVPAVLNSMDGYAIMPMEFPLLNLMGAPFFVFGPFLGKVLALLFLVILNFALTWLCYKVWRDKEILGHKVGPAFLLLPVVGISSTFVTKFMPDYLAMILALLGVGLLWERPASDLQSVGRKTWIQALAASLLIMLGMLVKPTAVTVLVLLFMHEGTMFERSKRILWTMVPLIIVALYYTVGLKWIASLQDTSGLYAVEPRPPLASVIDFFSQPKPLFKLIFEDLLFVGSPVLLLCSLPLLESASRKALYWLLGAIFLQLIAIAALDGSHSYVHSYYHIGTAPVVVLSLMFVLRGVTFIQEPMRLRRMKIAVVALFALGSASLMYQNLFFELRSLSARRASRFIWHSEVEALKSGNPDLPWGQGYVFRASRKLAYPNLGILFGEREGSSTSEFGFFLIDEVPSEGCRVIDQSQNVALVRCL